MADKFHKNRCSFYLPEPVMKSLKLLVAENKYGTNRSQVISYLIQEYYKKLERRKK